MAKRMSSPVIVFLFSVIHLSLALEGRDGGREGGREGRREGGREGKNHRHLHPICYIVGLH